jgi:hypothetical protein
VLVELVLVESFINAHGKRRRLGKTAILVPLAIVLGMAKDCSWRILDGRVSIYAANQYSKYGKQSEEGIKFLGHWVFPLIRVDWLIRWIWCIEKYLRCIYL